MNKKEPLSRKLTFGIFYLLSSSIATLGINVITVGFVARSLGVKNFGLYSAIFSFVGLFEFLGDFGLNRTLLKFGSTDLSKAQISFGNALLIKSTLIFPLIASVTCFGLLAGYRNEEIIILELFTISLVLDSYATVFSSIRRILGNFKLISFFRVLKTSINLLIIVIALSVNNSVLSLAIANTLLSLVIFIVSLINTVLLLKPKLQLNLIKDFFKDSAIFSLNDFFLNIYDKISTVLLSFFSEFHSVGIFSAALKFTKIANLLPNQVRFALLPTLYRLLEDRVQNPEAKAEKPRKLFTVLLKYLVIFATPAALLMYFFSDQIIHLIFGEKYDLSITLVQLLSLFIYLRFLEAPFNLFYIALHKHKNLAYLQGCACLLNIILNLILIPLYSSCGACYATLLSEIFFSLMLISIGIKYSIWDLKNVLMILLKPTIAGAASITLMTVLLSKANVLTQLLLLLISYFVFLLVMKVFDGEDKKLLKKIFTKRDVMMVE